MAQKPNHPRHNYHHPHLSTTEPTELDLSPSKARAHATTTHAWTQVTQWLTSLLSSASSTSTTSTTTLPPFERNPGTLTYLQALMHANRLADTSRRDLAEKQRGQLDAYLSCQHGHGHDDNGKANDNLQTNADADADTDIGQALLNELLRTLTPQGDAALTSLAEGCLAMDFMLGEFVPGGVPDGGGGPDGETVAEADAVAEAQAGKGGSSCEAELSRRMLALTASICEAKGQVEAMRGLKGEIEEEVLGLESGMGMREIDRAALDGAEGEERQGEDEAEEKGTGQSMSIAALRTQTSQLNAQTKHLALKAAEYRERLAALEHSGGGVRASIAELKQRENELETQKDILRRLENILKEYHGLPPDLEASRAEVKRAQAELEMWKRKREELFEEIGRG